MTDKERKALNKLERYYDALAADLDQLTDEEVLEEAKEDGEDVDQIATHMKELIAESVNEIGRNKLAAARADLDGQRARSTGKILQLPLFAKRGLVDEFTSKDSELSKKMTLAARSGKDTEADIDSFLEDLIELGVIDDEGNIT